MNEQKGNCDICQKKDGCKKADEYIKQLAATIVNNKNIVVCEEWKWDGEEPL